MDETTQQFTDRHDLAKAMLLDPEICEGANAVLVANDLDHIHFRIAGINIEYRRSMESWIPRFSVTLNGIKYIDVMLAERGDDALDAERIKAFWIAISRRASEMEEKKRSATLLHVTNDLARWRRNKDKGNRSFDGFPTATGYLGPDDGNSGEDIPDGF